MRRLSLAALLAGAAALPASAQTIAGPTMVNPAINPAVNPAIRTSVNTTINPSAIRVRPTTGPGGTAARTGTATGQNEEGSILSATIGQRIEANSNYNLDDPSPGTSYYTDTLLSVDYLNQTDTQIFGLNLNTGLRALWQAEEPFEFTVASPSDGALTYSNEWANGQFDASLDYRQRQVDSTLFSIDPVTGLPGDISQLTGYEQTYNTNIGVQWGTETLSSYELRFIGTQVDYTEPDPSQVARTTLEGQGAWNLQLNPVLSSQVSFDYIDYGAENDTNTGLQRSQIGLGLVYTPDENLMLAAGLDYADRRVYNDDENGDQETTESDNGPGINGQFSYTTPDLVFTGNAEYSTAAPTGRFFGALRADYNLPRGVVSARLYQNYIATGNGADEAKVTGASLSLSHDINSVSSLALGFGYATQVNVEETGTETVTPDINRTNITATYTHQITQAVDGSIGYIYSTRSEDPQNAQSNAVFVQIGRTFQTQP